MSTINRFFNHPAAGTVSRNPTSYKVGEKSVPNDNEAKDKIAKFVEKLSAGLGNLTETTRKIMSMNPATKEVTEQGYDKVKKATTKIMEVVQTPGYKLPTETQVSQESF
ncbi:hypothetical protein ACNVED_03235 [Legionella sp. D16C41]|uniref:hypothetical protein n=1 Tax=Legionella sp. D16C41 TaxID=3402688 RepID=UPI003AF5E250